MLNRLSRPALALSATALSALMLTACGSDDAPTVSAPTDTTSAASQPSTPAAPETSDPAPTTPAAPETSEPTTSAPEPTTEQPTSEPTKAPKPGKNDIVGNKKKFQVTLPAGWRDIKDKLGASQMKIIELAVADKAPSNGSLTNVNVASIKLPVSDTELPAKQSAEKYKKQGEVVKMLPKKQVAGETANGYVKHDKKKTQSQTQLFLSHKGTVYIITLTNNPKSQGDADKALNQIVDSWTWR